mmetsp:Transcript_18363/g.45085  ORF Transcript_18363/g.45085 Transcript_18363/m.45085 type:complete len:91 (-) Transcript_18363:403-675(-)
MRTGVMDKDTSDKQRRRGNGYVPMKKLLFGGRPNGTEIQISVSTHDSEDSFYREAKIIAKERRTAQLRVNVGSGTQVLKDATGDYLVKSR